MAEDEDRTEGEELFEDLEKFFAPIQDVDWPESSEAKDPDPRRDEPPPARGQETDAEPEPSRRSTMAFETESEEDDAEPAAEDVPAERTGVTDRSDDCSRTRARPRPSASRPATPRRPTSSRRTVSGRSCRRPRPRDTTQGRTRARSPSRRRPATSTSPARSRNRGSPS